MNKKQLDGCLNWIHHEKIRVWTKDWLENEIPDYFWVVPASSTGKYHPQYASEQSGLVKHTKTVFQIALDQLEDSVWHFEDLQKEIIKSAILLHDTRKLGIPKEKYTKSNHGVLVADAIMEECDSGSIRSEIAVAIASHMGQWNTNRAGQKVAPVPETEVQFFVHLCDYLASRKYMEVDFERMKV